jgi:hypothetical protein
MSDAQEQVNDILDMFKDDAQEKTFMDEMSKMSEDLAVMVAEIKRLKELEKKAKELKESLGIKMFQHNCANGHKFDNGIFPKPSRETSYYVIGEEGEVLKWLNEQELGDPRRIHFQALQGLIRGHVDLGKPVPEKLFTSSLNYSVSFSGNGHIKYVNDRTRNNSETKGQVK